MVRLYEVSKKLEDLLNGIDSETPAGYTSNFEYVVATEGLHLDKISDKTTHKNFIPVFIGSLGGTYNAVPNLKEADYTIPVTIYFPVRFKNDFYALNDYLVDVFVGKMLNYGTYSGKCLSNISVAQYGELAELDLTQFNEWIATTYAREVNIKQPYMSMTFNLFLSTIGSAFMYGNEVKTTLSFYNNAQLSIAIVGTYGSPTAKSYIRNKNKDTTYSSTPYYAFQNFKDSTDVIFLLTETLTTGQNYYTWVSGVLTITGTITAYSTMLVGEKIITTNPSIQSQSDPAGQQLLGTNESEGLPTNTSYSSGFACYFQNNLFFQALLSRWFNGETQTQAFIVEIELLGYKYQRTCYLQSVMFNPSFGEPITLTFTFIKKESV